ncbi:UDP-2,3-diacylglucosamine diphosphatase [Sulfurospirillum sp. 1307]
MHLNIKNGAIFIADSHENSSTSNFYDFLKKIHAKDIQTKQLFLMGDMFDLLVGKVDATVEMYEKYIDLLDEIALHVETIYFEGNHDFSLSNLFKNVKVIPIESQPVIGLLEDGTKVHLSHGDKFEKYIHVIYTKIIRSKTILKLLNIIDILCFNKVSKTIQSNQLKKDICRKIENFEEIISAKIGYYGAQKGEFILEGHYHQDYKFSKNKINYINLPSFACNQSYFIVECSLEEKFAHKK